MLSCSVISRITLHGLPAAKLLLGISFTTTLPAPITQLSPIVTPGQTTTFAPSQQSLPTLTGFDCWLGANVVVRSEEHTSELQSRGHLVCRLLLEKKKIDNLMGADIKAPEPSAAYASGDSAAP